MSWTPARTGIAALALLAVLLTLAAAAAGNTAVQGNPFRGRELLAQKLCTQCHSVWGHGGRVAPDMSTAVEGKSWFDLVGDFWNHTPRMIEAMGDRGHPWPTLDRSEMADLLSYMYYLRIFDDPGSASRGSVAYQRLLCADCHSLGDVGGVEGGPLDGFSAYPSPVALAQAMWNAGPAMQRSQLARGRPIPTFTGREIADIQAYIRAQGLRENREVLLLPLPDPSRGEEIFRTKRCASCHRSGAGAGPDLAASGLHLTVSEISGILWNHSYAMHDSMRAMGIPFPSFEDSELADLVAYLHEVGFVGELGDAGRGESIFAERGCASCHAPGDGDAIDISTSEAMVDPVALSTAMWNHAPQMHELMAERGIGWPTFDSGEMKHLAAYLKRLAAKTAGEGG